MARLEDLIESIADSNLRSDVSREVARLKANKKFGLVFEEHLPEVVEIPTLPIRKGLRVAKKGEADKRSFSVAEILSDKKVVIVPERGGQEERASKEDLVVVKRFGEPMYPALVPVASVARVEGKSFNTVINAENYHALQLLLYCYSGQVDAIYIDPPYNSGARDWKYNNDYVDRTDQYTLTLHNSVSHEARFRCSK
jgi:adenine-specific DNA-methyltransferase